MKHNILHSPLLIILICIAFSVTSCNDDDSSNNQNKEINSWIYNTMDQIYLWTSSMPSQNNVEIQADPSDFFKSLLYNGDRFSVIHPNYQELLNQLNGVTYEAGFEFQLSRLSPGSNEVLMLILYVKPDSPAEDAGLKRGDIITKVNNTAITIDNYETIVPQVYSNFSASYSRYNRASELYETKGTVNLAVKVIEENPNYLDTVYTINNSKIGYYVYNFFAEGVNDKYDNQMDDIIASFQSEGINELVLDLRYNGGGSVNSAINMGSLIGTDVNSEKIFFRSMYNDLFQSYYKSDPELSKRLKTNFIDKANNVGKQINHLYIIVTGHTASASELIINGLDPYMDITIIGETTVGKNVASTSIQDEENPNNNYGLLPIIARLENSEGYSDFEDGFTPLGDNYIKEFDSPIRDLGDTHEVLLSRAIELITGSNPNGRISQPLKKLSFEKLPSSSIDRRPSTNRAILSIPE
ncbi:S41 family peptidase [Fulvivirga sediminis]|uniref:PDZ domain-containing protein n=1 Tax=Fulvivirga sediminis TaxID=2803949 RepID=A0A937F6M0_9BACT|nr:S41 family peptidase [Fulvivirga sediminis]MBL3655275.1 PDZ domain-containing protein [Fulvivirga sediminis]